jgi:hypothetical protein
MDLIIHIPLDNQTSTLLFNINYETRHFIKPTWWTGNYYKTITYPEIHTLKFHTFISIRFKADTGNTKELRSRNLHHPQVLD